MTVAFLSRSPWRAPRSEILPERRRPRPSCRDAAAPPPSWRAVLPPEDRPEGAGRAQADAFVAVLQRLAEPGERLLRRRQLADRLDGQGAHLGVLVAQHVEEGRDRVGRLRPELAEGGTRLLTDIRPPVLQ